nr:MAG TPA: hypothetical protein [Bacteriophage sp.]
MLHLVSSSRRKTSRTILRPGSSLSPKRMMD